MKNLFLVSKVPASPKYYPTTVQLTIEQRLALHRVQIQRMVRGEPKPTMTEMVSEGLAILFKKEKIEEEGL